MDYMNVSGAYSYSGVTAASSPPIPVQLEASVRVMEMAEEIAMAAGADIIRMMNSVQGLGQHIDMFV